MNQRRLLILLVIVAIVARIMPQPRIIDDAFITFRYSRNVVAGEGFVYNSGEKILGTTTPLYAGVMALVGAVFGEHYAIYALILNAFADAAGVVFLFLIALWLTKNQLVAGWVALLWALSPYSVTFAIGGMETSVHNLFMLGAWYSFLTHRSRWLGVLCALGVLTRPDALLWALPLLLFQLIQHLREPSEVAIYKKLPLQTWAVGLLVIAPWLIFATLYFGSPIPKTISAKEDVYILSATQGLFQFVGLYAFPMQGPLLPGVLQTGVGILGLILYPFLALVGLRTHLKAFPMMIYPWVYALVFVVANPLIFRWYLTPPLPAYFLAIGCGLYALVSMKKSTPETNEENTPLPRTSRNILMAAAILTVAFTLNGWTLRPDHAPYAPVPQMAFNKTERDYKHMAKILREKYGVSEETVIAAGDIGALGFYTRAHIFDTIGLVTEHAKNYYDPDLLKAVQAESGNYAIPPDLILDRQPDYVVVMEFSIREGLMKDPRFLEQYELIEFIRTDYFGGGIVAFQRRNE